MLAAFGLVMVATQPVRADVIPSGKKVIDATFEVANIAEHPRYWIVAFPFGSCFPDDGEYFQLNPHHDRAEHNYEVLRPGQRYRVQKFCFNMELYAFERAGFSVRTQKLKQDLDWYRKKGDTLTIIDGFDQLPTTRKMIVVAGDPRVRRSGFRVGFPLVIDATAEPVATHDVLRITELSPKRMRVVGSELVLSLPGGKALRRPYVGGRRPSVTISADEAAHAPAAEPSSAKPRAEASPHPPDRVAAAGTLTAPAAPSPVGWVAWVALGGAFALGGVLLGGRRRRS